MPTMKRLYMLWVLFAVLCAACATTGKDLESSYSGAQLKAMGEKFLNAGDIGRALKFLTAAESQDPKDPYIQYDLALAYGSRLMDSQALAHFQKAIELKPDYSEAYNALGACYADRGNLDQAIDAFQKALGNPYYSTPHFSYFNLGRMYEKKGSNEEALKNYQMAVRLQPNYGLAYYRIGYLKEQAKQMNEAKKAYGKAVQFTPDMAEAQLRFGVVSYMSGDMENALYSLSKVLKLAPNSELSAEARKYLDRLQALIPGTPSQAAQVPPSEKMANVEVMAEKDLWRKESESSQSQPSPSAAKKPVDVHGDSGQWTYVIQVGSFLDKENAEDLRKKLQARGYELVLKPFNHQVLGSVYIVQMKPVNDLAKASTLMTQIEREIETKPILIKVPAN